jgi:hypothetical protein
VRDPWKWLTGSWRKDPEPESGIELQNIPEREEASPLKVDESGKSGFRKRLKKKKNVRIGIELASSSDDDEDLARHRNQLTERHATTGTHKLRRSNPDFSAQPEARKRAHSSDATIQRTVTRDAKLGPRGDASVTLVANAGAAGRSEAKGRLFEVAPAGDGRLDKPVTRDAKLRHVATSPIDALWICSASLISTEGGRGEARTRKKADPWLPSSQKAAGAKVEASDEDLDHEVENYLLEVEKRLSVTHLPDLNVSPSFHSRHKATPPTLKYISFINFIII